MMGLLWGLTIITLAYAEKADREKPLHITANEMDLDQKVQLSTFIGHVEIKQGTMQLYADKVSIREDQERYQYADGEGSPVKFRQKMDNSSDELFAQALRFNYDEKKGILTLYNKAWVKRGEDQISSDVIIYDLNQERYHAKTQKDQRVNVIFMPKKKNEKKNVAN